MDDVELVEYAKSVAPSAGAWGMTAPEIIEQSPAVFAQRIINEAERIEVLGKHEKAEAQDRYEALQVPFLVLLYNRC